MAEASGCRLVIDGAALPLAAGVDEVARALGADPVAFAAAGGEDYELLVCVPPAGREAAERAAEGDGGLTWIGEAVPGSGVLIDGIDPAVRGHEHVT